MNQPKKGNNMKTTNTNVTTKFSDNYSIIFNNLLFRIILNSEKNIIFTT